MTSIDMTLTPRTLTLRALSPRTVTTRIIRSAASLFLCLISTSAAHSQASTPPISDPTPIYRISGRVLSALDAHPLARASVTLLDQRTRNPVASTSATQDGNFSFLDVKPGKYSLNGSSRGYISASLDQHEQFSTAVVTGPNLDTSSLVLRLSPEAIIHGRVLDETGDPVRDANLTLYRETHNTGVSRIARFRNAATNDLGEYEFTGLAPGTFYLSVNAQPWYAVHAHTMQTNPGPPTGSIDPALDVVYPLTFYPGGTDSAAASPIPIKGAERVHLDLHLIPQPAVTLRLHTVQQGDAIQFPQLQRKVFDTLEQVQGSVTNNGGEFEISGLPQGPLQVRDSGNRRGAFASSRTINLTRGLNEATTSSAADDSARLTVTLQSEDGSELPRQMQVVLHRGEEQTFSARRGKDESDFRFESLPPATYSVNVSGNGRPYRISGIVAPEKDLPGNSLTIAPGSTQNMTLVVNGSQTSLGGFVKRNGKPAAGSMVVLVPVDPGAPRALYHRDQSDLDGSFALTAVLPGRYILVAIDDGWTLDWAKPELLAPYLLRGVPVAITGKEGATLNLSTSVSAQPR